MENLQVNHLDGNKRNNRLENLAWCTNQENTAHAHLLGLCKPQYGEYNSQAKLTEKEVIEIIELLKTHSFTQQAIGKIYGVSAETIGDIKRKRRWKHLTVGLEF